MMTTLYKLPLIKIYRYLFYIKQFFFQKLTMFNFLAAICIATCLGTNITAGSRIHSLEICIVHHSTFRYSQPDKPQLKYAKTIYKFILKSKL